MNKLKPGEKIPSVRKLAVDLTVNVNTVQRALQRMNDQGILYTKRGEGNFVTEDTELIKASRKELIDSELTEFIHNMEILGVARGELLSTLNKYLEDHQDDGNS